MAISGFSSTLSLAIVKLSPCSAAISPRIGAIILQGPHHSAQKSTITGLSAAATDSSNVEVVRVTIPAVMEEVLSIRNDATGSQRPHREMHPPPAGDRRHASERPAQR